MTVQERQEIFAKEYLSIADFEKLYDIGYNQASEMLLGMKKRIEIGLKQNLRIKIQGKIHIQDYLDCLSLPPERYVVGVANA